MNKIKFLLGPISVGLMLIAALQWQFVAKVAAITYTTFSDGQVLTAAQLNTAYSTVYNAFNSHNHDGGDGEASALAPSTIAATSTISAVGNLTVGDGSGTGTETSGTGITINVNTGDPRLTLQGNNSATNAWNILMDNSASDNLEVDYGGAKLLQMTTTGGLAAGGQTASSSGIAWEVYSGTTCTPDDCDTDVDTSAPGSGAPLSFVCTITDGTDYYTVTGDIGMTTAYTFYDASADDLTIHVMSPFYDNNAYNCIVFYIP